MVVLILEDNDAHYLRDIVQMWLEGHGEALDQTIADPAIETAEELLELCEGLSQQMNTAQRFVNMLDGHVTA